MFVLELVIKLIYKRSQAMKTLLLTIASATILLASCTSRPTYTFRSVKTGFEFEQHYNFASPHKIGDTITMPMYPGDNLHIETVDVILVAVK
jgi:hypothetical protein